MPTVPVGVVGDGVLGLGVGESVSAVGVLVERRMCLEIGPGDGLEL